MACGNCGSSFKRHGFDSGKMTQVSNGRVYPLATYSTCDRMYSGGKKYSTENVIVVAREDPTHERLFRDRNAAARYKRQLISRGVNKRIARVSAVLARDLCHDAVVDLFEPSVMQEQVPSEPVK